MLLVSLSFPPVETCRGNTGGLPGARNWPGREIIKNAAYPHI